MPLSSVAPAVCPILLVAACAPSRPDLDSCTQPLSGVWEDGADHRYHMLDQGPTLELYPIFPSPPPPGASPGAGAYSAFVYDFSRSGGAAAAGGLPGQRAQWLTTASGERLRLKMPAFIRDCHGQRITLVTGETPVELTRAR